MDFSASKRDLTIALSEINKMKVTTNFNDFKESWENYLFRIERVWETSQRVLQGTKGFEKWVKPYSELRKKDSLLTFLKQARHSEMHGISSAVSKPVELIIKDKTGRGLNVKSIASRIEKGTLIVNIESGDLFPDLGVQVLNSDPKLVKVKNRGKWYNPPWSHLKVRIDNLHPVYIAELGLEFYQSYIVEAEHWLNSC